ncbi:MAG: transposase [Clostridiales bacterium]|nr:transposase [Clostridiales bacterium]
MLALEDMVAEKAMVRVIDRFVEVMDLEKLGFEKTKPAPTGRPAYSPKALAKLYVYGYENGIRSSRRLEKETRRNVEAMWLVEGVTPDYKTIAEFRKYNLRPLQKLFQKFVKLCKAWDLIGGELLAVDGSKFKADNNKKMNFSRKKLDARLVRLDEQIGQYLSDMEHNDSTETDTGNPTELKQLLERKDLYEAYKKQLDDSGENELSVVDFDVRVMSSREKDDLNQRIRLLFLSDQRL